MSGKGRKRSSGHYRTVASLIAASDNNDQAEKLNKQQEIRLQTKMRDINRSRAAASHMIGQQQRAFLNRKAPLLSRRASLNVLPASAGHSDITAAPPRRQSTVTFKISKSENVSDVEEDSDLDDNYNGSPTQQRSPPLPKVASAPVMTSPSPRLFRSLSLAAIPSSAPAASRSMSISTTQVFVLSDLLSPRQRTRKLSVPERSRKVSVPEVSDPQMQTTRTEVARAQEEGKTVELSGRVHEFLEAQKEFVRVPSEVVYVDESVRYRSGTAAVGANRLDLRRQRQVAAAATLEAITAAD